MPFNFTASRWKAPVISRPPSDFCAETAGLRVNGLPELALKPLMLTLHCK